MPSLQYDTPFRAVVVVQDAVTDGWQARVSRWLVEAGCLYMMAWGDRCSSWDDSVDWAVVAMLGDGEIPADRLVMTTWHEDVPMNEAFWYAEHVAFHPETDLEHTLIVDIHPVTREAELIASFEDINQPGRVPED